MQVQLAARFNVAQPLDYSVELQTGKDNEVFSLVTLDIYSSQICFRRFSSSIQHNRDDCIGLVLDRNMRRATPP